MSYSTISGLELFQMPFSHQSSRQSMPPSGHSDTIKQQPVASAKAPKQQSGLHPAAKQPVAQAAKPVSETVRKADLTPKNAAENGGVLQKDEIKSHTPVQDSKTQAKVPEKQPYPEPNQKEQAAADMTKSPAHTEPKAQQKELMLDLSSGSVTDAGGTASAGDDAARRKAHEVAEVKRKAEWEAKQIEKKQAEAAALQKLQDMSDADIIAASTRRISTDVERITRRNMKECVAEHIQALCRKDPAFARLTMHPRKSMINCFKYINRKAKDFIQQEMKDHDIKPENGIYGSDVPDGLVYQWAEDYMHDADAPEDTEKEEKFVPKPYIGAAAKPKKAASKSKKAAKPDEKSGEAEKTASSFEQMSLF